MNVSVLDRKMRGLYTHHLDADLDLDLISDQNLPSKNFLHDHVMDLCKIHARNLR